MSGTYQDANVSNMYQFVVDNTDGFKSNQSQRSSRGHKCVFNYNYTHERELAQVITDILVESILKQEKDKE
jgi:hypothetical protein